MPSIFTLKNIEETINNLNYRSETTLKSKLIRAILNFYTDENSIEALTSINLEELVKYIWETGDDSALIKNKKKNFSSVKSSVNGDLKKLYQQGKNPQGIIINHNNVFDISDEAKNKALSDIAGIIREKDTASGGKTGVAQEGTSDKTGDRTLSGIIDILRDEESDFQNKINQITEAIQGILSEAISRIGTQLNNAQAEQIRKLFADLPRPSQTAAAAESADVTQIQDPEISTIINSVKGMLADALATNISSLGSDNTEQIKDLFSRLADKINAALGEGRKLDDIGIAAAWEKEEEAKDDYAEISSDIEEAEIEELVDITEESDIDQSMAEIDTVAEEVIEVVEESPEDGLEKIVPDTEESAEEELSPETGIEGISPVEDSETNLSPEDLAAVEIVETVDEIVEDEPAGSTEGEEISADASAGEIPADDVEITAEQEFSSGQVETEQSTQQSDGALENVDSEEIIEVDADDSAFLSEENIPEETLTGEFDSNELIADDNVVAAADALTETAVEELEDAEIIEEADGGEYEEIIEESVEGSDAITNAEVDEDLHSKADILSELASAAKVLEKIGPDLSNTSYSEEEIKQKAKLLSEEFDSYLSMRERFYNQHILIKSGNYPIGIDGERNGLPAQIVNLREFYIGKFPVTNALFEIFAEQTGYITTAERHGFGMVYIPRMQKVKNILTGMESFIWNNQLQYKRVPGACWYRPSGPTSTLHVKRTHPVVQVSLEDACAFAAWTGKRIPTEAEWEAATRTSRSCLYPWGNDWQDNACNLEKSLHGDTTPVDQYIKYSNDYEVVDCLGNVLEWTLDPWPTSGSFEEGEETYVVKGASWISDCPATLTDRQPVYKDSSSNILGFRCIAI